MIWARRDARTARYFYRQQYNIPRVSVENTDDLTEYEFDYELLVKMEFDRFIKHGDEEPPLEFIRQGDQAIAEKTMSTDPELYDEFRRKIEAGEVIDFELPDDSDLPTLSGNLRKRAEALSQSQQAVIPTDENEEFVSVDPAEVFGGDVNG